MKKVLLLLTASCALLSGCDKGDSSLKALLKQGYMQDRASYARDPSSVSKGMAEHFKGKESSNRAVASRFMNSPVLIGQGYNLVGYRYVFVPKGQKLNDYKQRFVVQEFDSSNYTFSDYSEAVDYWEREEKKDGPARLPGDPKSVERYKNGYGDVLVTRVAFLDHKSHQVKVDYVKVLYKDEPGDDYRRDEYEKVGTLLSDGEIANFKKHVEEIKNLGLKR